MAAGAAAPVCPLCRRAGPALHDGEGARAYWRCGGCALIFLAPEGRLDPAAERARYDLHRNDPADPDYRRFLSRLLDPLLERVPPGAKGLDFGCGPGPALVAMLGEGGRDAAAYDPYYAPDESVWRRTYDFITATEVFEHLYDPARELDRLFRVLRPGGWLAVMTRRPPEAAGFRNWHYRRDPTHVAFYSPATFEYIGTRWGAALEFAGPDVVLLHKHEEPDDAARSGNA